MGELIGGKERIIRGRFGKRYLGRDAWKWKRKEYVIM
jgi:hypothetical protein